MVPLVWHDDVPGSIRVKPPSTPGCDGSSVEKFSRVVLILQVLIDTKLRGATGLLAVRSDALLEERMASLFLDRTNPPLLTG